MALVKKIEKARLKDSNTYLYTNEIYFCGIKIYEYNFDSTKTEYVNEYKQLKKVGF